MYIGKNYKIESDSLNVTLYQGKIFTSKKTGETYEHWEVVGYYATVKNALHGLVNQAIQDTELKDIQLVVAKIDELHQLIDALPEGLQ